MQAALYFFGLWALAFVTLCAALVLLNIFGGIIGNDLILNSLGKELVMATIASLIEGGSLWLVITFVPTAARALVVPALIVALIYKIGHLEDWSRYDILLFLMFQIVIGCSGAFCYFGHFQTAIIIVGVFAGFVAVQSAARSNKAPSRGFRRAIAS